MSQDQNPTSEVVDDDVQGASGEDTPIIASDGTFAENWRDRLPEDLRGEKTLESIKDLPGAMKMLVHAQRKLGAEKIVKPTDKSSPEEWAEFYNAVGRPETAEGYKVELPKDTAQYYDKNLIAEAQKTLHEAGITQKQFDAIMAFEAKRLSMSLEQSEKAAEAAAKTSEETLRKDWGKDYEANLHRANRMIAENVPDDQKAELLGFIGNNATVAKFLANIASKFSEDTAIDPSATVQSGGGLADQIAKLRQTPGYADGTLRQNNRAEFDRIQKQLGELYKRAYPSK